MRSVGIRELKTETSEVLRRVREQGETIQVTHRGKPVALLVPFVEPESPEYDYDRFWTNLDRLAAEIGVNVSEGSSAADVVKGMRRDL